MLRGAANPSREFLGGEGLPITPNSGNTGFKPKMDIWTGAPREDTDNLLGVLRVRLISDN